MDKVDLMIKRFHQAGLYAKLNKLSDPNQIMVAKGATKTDLGITILSDLINIFPESNSIFFGSYLLHLPVHTDDFVNLIIDIMKRKTEDQLIGIWSFDYGHKNDLSNDKKIIVSSRKMWAVSYQDHDIVEWIEGRQTSSQNSIKIKWSRDLPYDSSFKFSVEDLRHQKIDVIEFEKAIMPPDIKKFFREL